MEVKTAVGRLMGCPGPAQGYDRTLQKQKTESLSHFPRCQSQSPKVSLLHRSFGKVNIIGKEFEIYNFMLWENSGLSDVNPKDKNFRF